MKYKVMSQLPSNRQVVLVADTVWPRICKIGYGLKSNGMHVVLLYKDELMNDNYSECFDLMQKYGSPDDAVKHAFQYKPLVFHVFSCWDFYTAAALICAKVGRVVFDDYDVLAGQVHPDFADIHYPDAVNLERFCLEQADALTCRALTLQPAKHELGYRFKRGVCYFPDYCWDKDNLWTAGNTDNQIHLVHAGNLNFEKLDPRVNHRKGWYFLEFARMAAETKVHFHLYPVPIYQDRFEELFSEHISLDNSCDYFHLHRPVKSNQLAEELKKYDFGLISVWSDFQYGNKAYLPGMSRYLTSNKLFDYLDSGLGVIVNKNSRLLKWYVEKNRVGFAADLEDVIGRLKSISPDDIRQMKHNTIQARKKFSVARQSARLISLYSSVADNGRRLVFWGGNTGQGDKRSETVIENRCEGNSVGHQGLAINNYEQPGIFTIETTLACDLRCPECAIGGGMIKRSKALMSFEQFKIIADKIRPYARYVYLHIWGEPLLNPDIFRMISYTARFARTNISTNGMSLTREKAEALISSGVSEVIVSIDGVSQEVYEQYRVGGEVRKAFEALAILNEVNVQHGGRVAISPQFVVFRHNQHEMEEFSQRCAVLGLQASFKAPYLRTGSRFSYGDFPEFQRSQFDDVTQLRTAMRECQNPREVFTVLVDGSVVICCHDYAGVTCFGNIFRQEVMAIWNSPEYAGFRKAIMEGRAPDFCVNNCMTWIMNKGDDESRGRPVEPEASQGSPVRINLCCGTVRLPGFINIDVLPDSDLQIDLEKELLPFPDGSVDCLVCISAINYFSYQRAGQIVTDVHRVLKPGGVARFATQDLQTLARHYLEETDTFYFGKLADGRDRFPGRTRADKFNEFFYGFYSGDKHCKYVYDFDSLAVHFRDAGFALVEKMPFGKSRIAGAGLFDNRPEQMFFLEAVKSEGFQSAYSSEQRFRDLLAMKTGWLDRGAQPALSETDEIIRQLGNDPERGWQRLLHLLETNPANVPAVNACADILKNHKRCSDLVTLYTRYLSVRPEDSFIQSELIRSQQFAEAENAGLARREQQSRPALIETLGVRLNSIRPDQEHLDSCMTWLCRAQDQNGRGGVSALYYLGQNRWDIDYPETTGYIIPTFLCYAHLTGKSEFLDRARRMGEWELAIQSSHGGAGEPYGLYGYMPRVFNTGQVMLGWLALYKETGQSVYLEGLQRAADWIVSCLGHDGKWSAHTYQGPKAYKSRVSWSLLELYSITGEIKYRKAAERSVAWILSQAEPTGWFRNCSLTDPDRPWTHLIGYVLVGLQEIVRLNNADIDKELAATLLHQAARGISASYQELKQASAGRYVTLPGTLSPLWQSNDDWSCVTGTAQLEFFLRRLGLRTNEHAFIETADMMLADVKQLQYLDGVLDPNIYGGLPGSYPLSGDYCSYAIPNWGVKFFSDGLLQRLVRNPVELPYIG